MAAQPQSGRHSGSSGWWRHQRDARGPSSADDSWMEERRKGLQIDLRASRIRIRSYHLSSWHSNQLNIRCVSKPMGLGWDGQQLKNAHKLMGNRNGE